MGLEITKNTAVRVPKVSFRSTQDILHIKISDSECIG